MNTTGLKKFAQAARRQLIEQVGARLDLVLQSDSAELREQEKAIKQLREEITKSSREAVVERVAYLWFNRFCALRFMDVNRYTRIGTVSPAEGFFQPEILQDAKQGHIDDELQVDQEKVFDLLGGQTVSADPQLIAELQRSVEGISYDEMAMPDLSQDDLDLEAARKFFAGKRSLTEQELITLKLLVRYQNRLVPSKGAILLFGKDRLFHFSDAWVQCGRFLGTEKIDIFDHIDIDVPLPAAVDEVMLFLKKHAYRADLSEIRRKDVWSIPLSILREVIINALVHADYSQRGAPIRVVFLDDRIEVENPGILLPGLTVEDMKQGTSKIRNTVIARVFRELDLIEQWGTGVRRIFQEAKAQGLPEPQIVETGMRLKVIIPLREAITIRQGGSSPTQSEKQINKLIQCLQDGEKSAGELRDMLGLKHRQTFRENYLHPALKQGVIEQTIPEKPNSRLQKYRLVKGK